MSFRTLNQMLEATYGPGNYLTTSQLKKGGGIILTPNEPLYDIFANVSGRPETDARWTQEKITHGDTSISLGCFPITGELMPRGYDGVFLYGNILKHPGEIEYRVPQEFPGLSFAVQGFADYVAATTRNQKERICGISLRILPLKENVRQIGSAWHIHKPFELTDRFLERAGFFEITKEDLDSYRQLSQLMVQTEGYISNVSPTRIQIAPSAQPLALHEGITDYVIEGDEEWPVKARQPGANELVVASGTTYHAASPIKPGDIGKTRMLLVMSSMPTQKFEAQYGLG